MVAQTSEAPRIQGNLLSNGGSLSFPDSSEQGWAREAEGKWQPSGGPGRAHTSPAFLLNATQHATGVLGGTAVLLASPALVCGDA